MFPGFFCLGWLGLSLSLSDGAADSLTCHRGENKITAPAPFQPRVPEQASRTNIVHKNPFAFI